MSLRPTAPLASSNSENLVIVDLSFYLLFVLLFVLPMGVTALLILVPLWAIGHWLKARRRCGVCKCALTGTMYDWTVDGHTVKTCVECNKRMRAKVSRTAVDELHAGGSRPAPK